MMPRRKAPSRVLSLSLFFEEKKDLVLYVSVPAEPSEIEKSSF